MAYIVGLTLAFACQTAIAASNAPQIWFNMTNYKGPPGVDGQQGWDKLFGDPKAPWPEFMNHVDVVAAAGIAQIPDDVLAKAMAKLKQKHVAFAIESLAQSWVNQPKCGHGVESYYDPPGARKVAEKIQAAGGELAFIAMDEPLFFGRYYNGHDACHSSLQNSAERAAAILQEYIKVFPSVVIGDIEPIPGVTDQPEWQSEYKEWMRDFNTAVGKPISFLHIDVNWGHNDWPQSLQKMAAFAHGAHLPIGIIYNGSTRGEGGSSNEGWLRSGVENFTEIESRLHIVPNQVIFHSWSKFPPHSITDETGPGEDYLVKQYLKLHAE